jgi:hypothetical protein
MFAIHDAPNPTPVSAWIDRVFEVAQGRAHEQGLRAALAATPIGSVGPVVTDELKTRGLQPTITPANDTFFMKPLISAMAAALGAGRRVAPQQDREFRRTEFVAQRCDEVVWGAHDRRLEPAGGCALTPEQYKTTEQFQGGTQ